MRPTSDSVKAVSVDSMKGRKSMSEIRMTNIFGTKVSVISWICVKACRKAMARPMTSARSMIGAPSLSVTMIVSCARSTASAAFTRTILRSDRQSGDILIGLNDTVAHRDDRLQDDLGIGHGGGHLREVGLAGDRLQARRLALLQRVDGVARRLFQE